MQESVKHERRLCVRVGRLTGTASTSGSEDPDHLWADVVACVGQNIHTAEESLGFEPAAPHDRLCPLKSDSPLAPPTPSAGSPPNPEPNSPSRRADC